MKMQKGIDGKHFSKTAPAFVVVLLRQQEDSDRMKPKVDHDYEQFRLD